MAQRWEEWLCCKILRILSVMTIFNYNFHQEVWKQQFPYSVYWWPLIHNFYIAKGNLLKTKRLNYFPESKQCMYSGNIWTLNTSDCTTIWYLWSSWSVLMTPIFFMTLPTFPLEVPMGGGLWAFMTVMTGFLTYKHLSFLGPWLSLPFNENVECSQWCSLKPDDFVFASKFRLEIKDIVFFVIFFKLPT